MSKKHVHLSENIEFPDQKILPQNMEKRVRQSFLEYSMSVITSRALPDVRDGMKPGQRRILYAMYEDHLTSDKPFRKSATTVGNVLGRYHPHGDAAVYQTMVRMAQDFSLRYPLIEGHGNFGNVDGDGAAAYRYTEARMAKIANELMDGIEKNVVDMVPNFDSSRKEPTVLPSRFPNILVNGSVGIAVGMATNIPPHNLREVIDGAIYRIDHPECSVPELMQCIKGPDFPTHGIIYGTRGIEEAYATGHGRILVRARCQVEEEHHRIVVTEIPYMVNKSQLVRAIADLVNDKKIEGITDLRDESGRAGMRIVIEYRRDANGEVILNQLYKYSQLQDTCAVNMLVLVGGEPKVLSLPAILDCYLRFQEEIIERRTQFDLDKSLREMHILEGYQTAIDHIDEVIAMIRASSSVPEAKATLMERFSLSDAQGQAIVEMPLGKLSGLERQKIEERLARLAEIVSDLRDILARPERVRSIVKEEMTVLRDRYGDERRTQIEEATAEIALEDLIERHTCVITMTREGYIKRLPADTYSAQNRGGKGLIGMTTKDEDFVDQLLVANSHSYLMLFTNQGRVYTVKAYRIPESSRTAKGTNLVNILDLSEGEKVTALIAVNAFPADEYLTMVTRRGIIKRTLLSEYAIHRRGGKIALGLDEGDELWFVRHTRGDGELVIATEMGQAIRFREDTVRPMGRSARGVIGIRLSGDDYVVGVAVVDDSKTLLTITKGGYGKRTDFADFRMMKNRGGMGVTCQRITDKTGRLASIATVDETDDVMMITSSGTVIRIPVAGIPVYSRSAGGVIVMRLDAEDEILSFARVEKEEEILREVAEADAAAPPAEEEDAALWESTASDGENPEDGAPEPDEREPAESEESTDTEDLTHPGVSDGEDLV